MVDGGLRGEQDYLLAQSVLCGCQWYDLCASWSRPL